MSSREEKLAAARKKLREFQGKSRQDGDSGQQASRKNSTATNSPTPSYAGSDSRILIGTESPFEPNRLAYERRETVQISESPLHNRPTSRPTPPYQVGINSNANDVQSENLVTDNSSILLQMQGHIQYLQSQLVARDQAISVLVTERNDANSELSRVQSELQHKADSIEVINSKYLEASKRIYELDNASPRPMTSVMVTQVEEELRAAQEIAAQKIAQLEERLQEHRFRLEAKSSECDILGSQVQTLSNSLSVAEVKIQQLTTEESQKTNSREAELGEENGKLKKEIQLLGRKLQAAAMEGEQAAHRFQQYADQCNSQQNALKAQVQELSRLNFMLKEEKTSIAAEFERFKSDISATRSEEGPLEERIGVLNKEKAQLFQQFQEKVAEVSSMASQLEELKGHRDSLLSELELVSSKLKEAEAQLIGGHADPALLAAIESDKVAASRAVSQNQQLKQQLTELQLAFIRVSDEKLELTDKLLNAQHENSVLKNLAGNEEQGGIRLDQLQGKVAEILTGLQRHRQNCDLKHSKETKENQCNDHDGSHSHDHSHGHNRDHGHGHSHDHGHEHHHHEEAADGELEALIKQTADVFEGLRPNPSHESHASHNHGHSHSHGDHNHDHDHDHKHSGDECTEGDHHHLNNANQSEVDELRRVIKQLQADKDLLLQRLGSPIEDPEVQGLLEVKLRRTMDEIAVLDEEKQRLEHMVVQLQEETETIGEYITLYHKQRLLLKQRAVEKDEQLIELAKDREDLKQKLSALNQLVSNLVSGNSAVADMDVESAEPLQDTADKIHSLITEIGKNKVVSAQQTAFDQCACCSGRLITI